MLNRRYFLSACVVALAIGTTAAHADDWKSKYKELTFAVVPAENASADSASATIRRRPPDPAKSFNVPRRLYHISSAILRLQPATFRAYD